MGWLDLVEGIAPTIATCLGGPLAGAAVGGLEQVFGITPAAGATVKDRTAAVSAAVLGATPEQLAAVRKADQDFQAKMAELGFKDTETIAQLAVEDRESARGMQISTRSRTAPFLALLITGGFFGTMLLVMFEPMVQAAHDAATLLLGSLGTAWVSVVSFYFGSSEGSQRKDELHAASK